MRIILVLCRLNNKTSLNITHFVTAMNQLCRSNVIVLTTTDKRRLQTIHTRAMISLEWTVQGKKVEWRVIIKTIIL